MVKYLFLIFVGICYNCNISYACDVPPVPGIGYNFIYDGGFYCLSGVVGVPVEFDGVTYSYDPDDDPEELGGGIGITEWDWKVWASGATGGISMTNPNPSTPGYPSHVFTEPGCYEIELYVKDNDGEGTWSEDCASVFVLIIEADGFLQHDSGWNLEAGPIYIPVDDEDYVYLRAKDD